MVFLRGYGCVSTHGSGARLLFTSLCDGISEPSSKPSNSERAFYFPERDSQLPMADRLGRALTHSWREALGDEDDAGIALIFASTKGCVEDYIWGEARDLGQDPFQPILNIFFRESGISPRRVVTVSNACASAHSGLLLASEWISSGREKAVAVLAADGVGPFTLRGFSALHALAAGKPRPFSGDRDGLLLGEGAAVTILSRQKTGELPPLALLGVGIDCEGYAATRPSESGASLAAAVAKAKRGSPGLIIAHGTGTRANDAAEDSVYRNAFLPNLPPLTCTKWSIGHTMGASGLLDLVAGAEILRRQIVFPIATTGEADPEFRSRVLCRGSALPNQIKEILISSLGFGGVHAAVTLGLVEDPK